MSTEISSNNEQTKRNCPLIVSYSYSGNTRQIAQELQANIGGDWCEIHS